METMEIPRYFGDGEDNIRWNGFPFRDDDIIIVTQAKCGTTWVQMLIALMIFRTNEFPRPLWNMSRWVDHTGEPVEQVFGELEAQAHRRFLKTHTPLWGLPKYPGVKYVMVTRDPLDTSLSMWHHLRNQRNCDIRLASTAREHLRRFVNDESPVSRLTHTIFSTGFALTHPDPDLLMIRYEDLLGDVRLEAKKLAFHLELPELDDNLLSYAGIGEMRVNSGNLVPLPDTFTSTERFFRSGTCGKARRILPVTYQQRYDERMSRFPDVAGWYA